MIAGSELNLPEHRRIAHVLIERAGTVLLLHRREGRYLGGQWDIPGGTVEIAESPAQAAQREAWEETSMRVDVGDQISHFTNADTNGRPICFHTVTFSGAETTSDTVVLRLEEHDRYLWLPKHEALELDLVWHVRRTLADHTATPAWDDLLWKSRSRWSSAPDS